MRRHIINLSKEKFRADNKLKDIEQMNQKKKVEAS